MFRAAKEVTRIFREAECTFAILGSTACYLDGNDCLPNVSSLVLATVDKQGLPVVPRSNLLLHKLKGWEDHMKSVEPRLRSKHDADVGDICSLLRIVIEGMNMQEKKNSTHWKQFALERFGEEFRDETERRVNSFCWKYPAYRDMWQTLGW
ncbi:hypothetical protein EDD85DRAFT_946224 [Armillaria nabsnona]|nr:hypothetical protein EDD85DRAFT_946224 [Armillaria nabsnona]